MSVISSCHIIALQTTIHIQYPWNLLILSHKLQFHDDPVWKYLLQIHLDGSTYLPSDLGLIGDLNLLEQNTRNLVFLQM